ncbi:MAG: flagellar basal body-associated FliL family protein [Gemmatimonadota bacterium]|nr:flagellar basal body-associated FliL family protein [Gemmatimonadota bacterium]
MAEETPENDTPGDAVESAPKSKLPLIIAIAVGLAVGGGSGAVLVGPMIAKKLVKSPVTADSTASKEGGEAAKGEHGEAGKGAAAAPPIWPIENLVLNPQGSGGSRYLLLSVAIESVDAKGLETITLHDAELRDLILTTLARKTAEELSDISHRELLKGELVKAIIARFGKASVKQLYFPQFVIQ